MSGTGYDVRVPRNPCRLGLPLICIISAAALSVILFSVILSDCSSADGDERFRVDLENADGGPLTGPIIDDAYFSFDTMTRPDGVYYELDSGVPIDSTPAYFTVRAVPGADRILYRITVGMENASGTWMEHYGIRVLTDGGCYADLTKENNFQSYFLKNGEITAFGCDTRYSISLVTIGGSQKDVVPGHIENIRIFVEATPTPGYHEIEFVTLGEVIETRYLKDTDELGPLPVPERSGFFFEGWYDSEGTRVNARTVVSEMSSDVLEAKWSENPEEWPKITHTVEVIVDPDGTENVIDTTVIEQSDGSYERIVVETITHPDGSTERKDTYEDVDPDGEMDRTSSTTSIVEHDDGTETWNTETVTEWKDGSYETSTVVTEFDEDSNKIYEWSDTVKTDTQGESREYIVTAEVVDVKEMKYRVEAIIPETTILDVDNAKNIIDRYDYTVAVVGTHSDSGLLIVPEDTMQVVAHYGYYLSVSNDEQYVALDDNISRYLAEAGGEVRLQIEKATEGMLTPSQAEVIGDAYAVSITLFVNGVPVTQPIGVIEVVILPGYASVSVYRVEEDGSTVQYPCTYDPDTGKVKFSLDHLSIYMIEPKSESHVDIHLAIAWAMLVFVTVLICVILRMTRRDEDG